MIFVRNWLAIGSIHTAAQTEQLTHHHIGAVLMLAEPVQQPVVPALCLPIDAARHIPPHTMHQAMEFVYEQRNLGRRILIACEDGEGAAPAFAIAAINEQNGGTLNMIDVYKSLLRKRPSIHLRPALWESLQVYFESGTSYQALQANLQSADAE